MPDEAPNSTRSPRRSRSQRSKLRRDLYIDQVRVEEPFVLNNPRDSTGGNSNGDRSAGEGCYVTATVNARRYYGVLIDQAALKSASLLHFQEEASGLDLNRRMMALSHQQRSSSPSVVDAEEHPDNSELDLKRPATSPNPSTAISQTLQDRKRRRGAVPDSVLSNAVQTASFGHRMPQQVQKFRYVASNGPNQDYRELLATFASVSAAAEDDPLRMKQIEAVCQAGGDFIGQYYFQYEPTSTTLEAAQSRQDPGGMRMSLGFQMFLRKTELPVWFPLSNLEVDQQKVLNIMNLKKDNKGNVLWVDKAVEERGALGELHGLVIPMQPRSLYRVCVVGGGIAGLSSCLEIFRRCERDHIEIEVVLLEGRSRLGGRLWTDRETFKRADEVTVFPVDLGASWIHGIELNPLATLAREAGIDFVRTSEDLKMFKRGLKEVDADRDHHAGELFDKLLDIAADSSWGEEEIVDEKVVSQYSQSAVRWYASVLGQGSYSIPLCTDVGDHRRSTDLSVDRAVGNVIATQLLDDFERLSCDERRVLMWNLKNVEYALGANLSDLSMKFWDIDERHKFDGDHVILRQGYSSVVEHLLKQLQGRGGRFQYHLNYTIDKIEYARKTTSQTHMAGASSRSQQFVDLSDACCVTSKSGESVRCDFVVCAVPLGVLKEAVRKPDETEVTGGANNESNKIEFSPPLPFLKRDAIEAVGFGLLDKVYLQFPVAFWRIGDCSLDSDQTVFGNASGVNPHHYMFIDIGKSLGHPDDAPAVIMSLVSGREAVRCENLSQDELVQETLDTLRAIFSEARVSAPIAVRTTRWGADPFSRGSYTFLPPGTTDQDFRSLQSPCNGNGDSILLEGSETMRLFFAGEHTTALHPSTAHGALLSGIRAGEEVVSAMSVDFKTDETFDKLIPMAVFRHMNPKTPLECSLCHLVGGRTYEGPLLAFKRGSRQVLVHNCCAEYSPEVEVEEGQWRYVLKAVNRSASIQCSVCKVAGASIGCNHENCFKSFHFRCAEKSGWKFEDAGKEFFCEAHRRDEHGSAPTTRKRKGDSTSTNGQTFQHALFSVSPSQVSHKEVDDRDDDRLEDSDDDNESEEARTTHVGRLASDWCDEAIETRLVRLRRSSLGDLWNIEFQVKPLAGGDGSEEKSLLVVESGNPDDPVVDLVEGGIVKAINGLRIGSEELDSLEKVICRLSQEVDILLELECDAKVED